MTCSPFCPLGQCTTPPCPYQTPLPGQTDILEELDRE